MRFLSLLEGKTGRSRGARGRSLPAGSLMRVSENIFRTFSHLEYSSLLLRASIPSLPFFLIKVKVSETIQYRVLASKLFLGST